MHILEIQAILFKSGNLQVSQLFICSPMSDELYYTYHVWHTTHTNDESYEYSVCHESHTCFHVNFKSDWTNHFILMRCNCIQISFNKYDAYPLTKRRYTVWTLILIFNWDEQLKKWHGHSFNSFLFLFLSIVSYTTIYIFTPQPALTTTFLPPAYMHNVILPKYCLACLGIVCRVHNKFTIGYVFS